MLRLVRALRCRAVTPAVPAADETSLKLYEKLVSPRASQNEVVSLANELIPLLATRGTFSVAQQHHILQTLSARSIRHEGVLQKCMWGIFKADLRNPALEAAYNRYLAMCTASTFHVMMHHGFRNDNQMTALALGRCIELAPIMPLAAVEKVYRALAEMNQTFFSITSVALYESEVNADFTVRDPLLDEDHSERTLGALANQPNLIDVLCAELEGSLHEFAKTPPLLPSITAEALNEPHALCVVHEEDPQRQLPGSLAGDAEGDDPQRSGAPLRFVEMLSSIAHSFAAVGVTSPTAMESLGRLFEMALPPVAPHGRRVRWGDQVSLATHLIAALRDVCRTQERVLDPMNHQDSHELADARAALAGVLTTQLCQLPHLSNVLRRCPPLVLSARSVFEQAPQLAEVSPALWDQVRTVRVAQKHVIAAKAGGRSPSPRLGGKLFDRSLAVKVKPITQDLSAAERFVPPQFKTWRSPAHSPRGGHKAASGGGARAVKFGTRRISKNYLKNLRKRVSQGG